VPGGAVGTPVHDRGIVYFLSKERQIVALDAESGGVRWRTDTGIVNRAHVFGTMTAGTAVRLTRDLVIGADWDVIGFDRRTGQRRWVYEAPGGDGPGLYLGAVADDTVYTGSVTGRVYAIDASSGRLRWSTPVVEGGPGEPTVFEPIVAGGVVAAGFSLYKIPTTGGLVALDAITGKVRWRTEFPRHLPMVPTNRTGGPVLIDDLLVASAGDGNVYAVDVATGAIRWTFPRLDGPFESILPQGDTDHRTIAAAGRLVIAGSALGMVVAYDIDTRRERWRHDAGQWGSTTFSLVADDRLVYVPFFGGFIIALDLATGEERWRFGDSAKGMIWAPAPAGDRIFASASRSGFYALATRMPEARP
jgi:outer membrane protein assembly factor BamB